MLVDLTAVWVSPAHTIRPHLVYKLAEKQSFKSIFMDNVTSKGIPVFNAQWAYFEEEL